MLSFVCLGEKTLGQSSSELDDGERKGLEGVFSVVKTDLQSLQFNLFHIWMKQLKTRLHKMIIPAIIESQSVPGFIENHPQPSDPGPQFLSNLLPQSVTRPQFSMDDLIGVFHRVHKAMKAYYLEESIIHQAFESLLHFIDETAFNDLLMRYILAKLSIIDK